MQVGIGRKMKNIYNMYEVKNYKVIQNSINIYNINDKILDNETICLLYVNSVPRYIISRMKTIPIEHIEIKRCEPDICPVKGFHHLPYKTKVGNILRKDNETGDIYIIMEGSARGVIAIDFENEFVIY